MKFIRVMIVLGIVGCGRAPKIACDAYASDAGMQIGGVTDTCNSQH